MTAFLAEESYDMPIRDEPEFDFSAVDPRLPFVGDSSRSGRHGSNYSRSDRTTEAR